MLDAILEQGLLLDLPWGLDMNHDSKTDPPTNVGTEEETPDA